MISTVIYSDHLGHTHQDAALRDPRYRVGAGCYSRRAAKRCLRSTIIPAKAKRGQS